MCGISGFISQKELIRENSIRDTLNLMKLRGPDNASFYEKDYQNKKLALLHSRLNIIDLNDRSNQPFIFENFKLIFNGEIYNYLELKKKLKKKYIFKTDSDTEVLARAYQEYGENCVNYFEGMWAFAIWDERKKELFLSRDPFGEKPLYYYFNSSGFFFGSEIKFIKSLCKKNFTKNRELISKNLFLGYKSLFKKNETFFNEIYNLESGTNLRVNFNLSHKKKKYWSPKIEPNKNLSKNDAIKGVKYYLTESLKLRLRSDVPLAFCLSGGIDSSALASLASKEFDKKVSTFSIIDNDPRYDERENINLVINDLKCDSHLTHLKINKENFFERINKLTYQHDGPIATISYYIHSFLSEEISKQNFKVAISGTGADEIFTGYYDHFLLHLASLKDSSLIKKNLKNWEKYVSPFIRNPNLKNALRYINNEQDRSLVYENDLNVINYSTNKINFIFEEKKFCDELLRNRMLNELFYEVVPVILKHDDLNSMFYSIENRSPYLDKNLLEFVLSVPNKFLIEDGYQKKLLRDSLSGILNDQIRLDRQKKGFNASIKSILDIEKPEVLEYIFDTKSELSEFINLKKLKSDIYNKEIPNHMSKLIFSLIGSKIFLEGNF
ncbi:asparagine synthase (glutamine-hydrolyzing) [Candidatus Pelagibacter sp.]|uniref:asparagine synthase (glutamine-hydrolyzing) n=1 Tax=Candidatus Pelagibacter sp. TaxID=2024849 RepID=UPI003F870D14